MGNSNIKRYQRVVSMMLMVVMLLTGLPVGVFASTNVNTGETVSSGHNTAAENWGLPRENTGRFSFINYLELE